jgi:hypothetical protein
MLALLGRILFPGLDRDRRRRETRFLLGAILVGLLVGSTMVLIFFLVTKR